ncbi:MAG TPA: hypothetical protein P5511_07385, partial [Candidatus Goldiibacteriota bacterium]|nr:hypothetical protein [Candidatus Goldiibacteriota bacterium]
MDRYILSGISLLLFVLGQFLLFVKSNYILGGFTTFLAIIGAAAVYLNLHQKIWMFLKGAMASASSYVKSAVNAGKNRNEENRQKHGIIRNSAAKNNRNLLPAGNFKAHFRLPAIPLNEIVFRFAVPK